jgi:xylan 1,4-beta-xylosidase
MKSFQLLFANTSSDARVSIQRVDNEHGNTLAAYKALGSPVYPTEEQIQKMNAATRLPPPEEKRLAEGKLNLRVEPNGLVLLEVRRDQ